MNKPSPPNAPGFARFMIEAMIYHDSCQKRLLISKSQFQLSNVKRLHLHIVSLPKENEANNPIP